MTPEQQVQFNNERRLAIEWWRSLNFEAQKQLVSEHKPMWKHLHVDKSSRLIHDIYLVVKVNAKST